MNSKKSLLLAAGLAACSGSVLAAELDDRWYLSGGIGYVFADGDRDLSIPGLDVDDGPAAFVGFGKAINDWLNLELNVKWNRFDLGSGNGDWNQYGATIDGLVPVAVAAAQIKPATGTSTAPRSTACSSSTATPGSRRTRWSAAA